MLTKEIGVMNNLNVKQPLQKDKWIRLLCRYGDLLEFTSILDSSVSTQLAIMKYRRVLNDRRTVSVSLEDIYVIYTAKEYDKLHNLFEHMFLEPLSSHQFEFILKQIDDSKGGIEKLYNKYLKNQNIRLLNIALTL